MGIFLIPCKSTWLYNVAESICMREIVIKKAKLHETQLRDDLRDKSPDELIGMMWQLALNAWSFKETVDVEPRLQRHVVVLKRGRG